MTYAISELNAIQVIEVSNIYSDHDTKPILSDIESRIEKGSTKFIVDLADLRFINSVGLNFLILLMTRSKQVGGKLAIVNASDQVINLMQLTKLKTKFNLKASLDEAVLAIA